MLSLLEILGNLSVPYLEHKKTLEFDAIVQPTFICLQPRIEQCVGQIEWVHRCSYRILRMRTVKHKDLPICSIALSVIFDPRPLIEFLHSLFRCLLCRSQEMFRPGRPCTLTVCDHMSCVLSFTKKKMVLHQKCECLNRIICAP